jgi:hypothetical protein
MIRMKSSGEIYQGIHQPIITKQLFDQVQDVLAGKRIKKVTKHFFVFRRLVRCTNCGRSLTPEIQKKIYIYYRCHRRACTSKVLPEDVISTAVEEALGTVQMTLGQLEAIRACLEKELSNSKLANEQQLKGLQLQLEGVTDRHNRLVDAYMDGIFDKKSYFEKKAALIDEETSLRERIANGQIEQHTEVLTAVELATDCLRAYRVASPEQRRDMLQSIVDRIETDGSDVHIRLSRIFDAITKAPRISSEGTPTQLSELIGSIGSTKKFELKNVA